MGTVTSKDGTSLSYGRAGSGPAVIMVGGAADDGAELAPVAAALSEHFTVYNYARRGRGKSGDTAPYALEREIGDLEAVIAEAGGAAHVYGASSGGALALEAAAAGLPINKLVVYEVPYDISDDAPQRHQQYKDTLQALLDEDNRAEAFAHAMRTWGAPEEAIERAKQSPMWPGLVTLAPTLAYDAACMGDNHPPTARLAKVDQPTLVLTGGASPTESGMDDLRPDFFGRAADAIVESLPHGERQVVGGQQHVVDPAAVVPLVQRFLAD
ncbi:alpha/beta fold hydrolase [Saccharopolyspora erythraea]|uniref:alpha/beta fold hydrolase n=1 Tax=Saccharopolyspora erythraea TaxID=1836 RepID=UPI001BA68C59|nr:alpha/beta fold hydrolase [Saccharopolyspora erythraea]QUH01971.1 alpha/beta fold hydrolase [Saccharopolyspora erythraea]